MNAPFAKFRDFESYVGSHWTIDTKQGKTVPFRLKPSQRLVQNLIDERRKKRKPIRLRILKYRQAGISSYCTALGQHLAQTRIAFGALSIADKLDLPAQWLRRGRKWLEQTPSYWRPQRGATNANELWFSDLRSRYYIGSATGHFPAMGHTLRYLHCSEIASWPMLGIDPDILLADMIPAIPPGPETWIPQESTGRVIGDWWYKAYYAAKKGEVDYDTIFLPWYIDPDYRLDASDIIDLTKAEQILVKMGVDREQLAWRRYMLTTEYHGDDALFANQFPATEEEAFLSAGRNVFTAEEVAKARDTIREPIWRGDIIPGGQPSEFRLAGSDGGPLLIWEHPEDGKHYAIGADVQWGKSETADYDACYVECVETGKICARWWGRVDMFAWSRILASLGHYYNTAALAPENNTEAGKGVMWPLLGLVGDYRYPNLWVQFKKRPYGALRPVDYGWHTDAHTKPDMVISTHEAIFAHHGMDWADKDLVDEMASFITDKNAKMTAPKGQNDDRLMARMITGKVAESVRVELASRPLEPFYGELTDFQHRIIEQSEKLDEEEAQEEREFAGIEEW